MPPAVSISTTSAGLALSTPPSRKVTSAPSVTVLARSGAPLAPAVRSSGVVGHADIARRPQRRRPLHRQRAARARHLQVAGQPAGRARGAIAILQRPARHLRRTAQLSQHHQFAARHRGLAQEGAIGARQERGAGDLVQAVRAAARAQQPCREPVGGIGMVEAQRGDARAELDRAGVERARTRSRLAGAAPILRVPRVGKIRNRSGASDTIPCRRRRR